MNWKILLYFALFSLIGQVQQKLINLNKAFMLFVLKGKWTTKIIHLNINFFQTANYGKYQWSLE